MEQRPNRELQHRQEHVTQHHLERRHHPNAFFGLDVEAMSPVARVAVGLVVMVPILLTAQLFFIFGLEPWWIFFTYAWAVFPASGLLIRGISGISDGERQLPSAYGKELELLRALREHGELIPARAATETSLPVSEADEMLKDLVEGGHLDVRVRGGGLFYGLWEAEGAVLGPGGRV